VAAAGPVGAGGPVADSGSNESGANLPMQALRGDVKTATRDGRRATRWVRISLLALMLTLFLWTVQPSSARAGIYRVYECYQDAGAPGATDLTVSAGFDAGPAGGVGSPYAFGWNANCTAGGYGIEVWGSAYTSGPRWAGVSVIAPSGTYLHTGGFLWQHHWDPGVVSQRALAGYVLADNGQPLLSLPADRPGNSGFSAQNVTIPVSTVGRSLSLQISCPSGGVCAGYDSIAMKLLNLELVDTIEPRVVGLTGSLVDELVAHGLASLRIIASDQGGGIRTVSVEVNGQRVASPATSCAVAGGGTYVTQIRPCPDFDQTIQIDTERPPWRDGQNTLRVCVSDVATEGGPPYTTCEQRVVSVDNSCPDSSGAAGIAQAIEAGLEEPGSGRLRRTRSVRSTEGVTLRGSLGGPGGPVRAASVCVYEKVDEPAGIAQLVQVAKSTSNGTFAAHLPAGPSRVFQVAYRHGDRQIEAPSMYLESSVLPTLRLTKKKLSNGRSVGFRGWIPGPNNDGRSVTLQARVGKKWRSFKQLQTNSRGSFKGKYRFTQTRGRVLYVFRALIKKQGGYPYSPGSSKKQKVLVSG
jgi:hypothetical protein